ncbi:MAG: hypothetical protein H6555_12215 [Lewinellaceae bacterium]|nr:hypothetical protein [Lewinellaceae bacterium]
MKNQEQQVSFKQFLGKFPEVTLPVTLTPESQRVFSQENDPIPMLMIDQFLAPLEEDPIDEYTEFVPCFQVPDTGNFHALVYWRAGLMDYRYILATFTKQGVLIAKQVIAGTYTDGKTLTQSVATFTEDWVIQIVSGQSGVDASYEAAVSTSYQLELLPEGFIVPTN